jgi:hypothetical protein
MSMASLADDERRVVVGRGDDASGGGDARNPHGNAQNGRTRARNGQRA